MWTYTQILYVVWGLASSEDLTFCDLPSLWRVSMIVFWIIAKSAVFPIIVVSKNKRFPEFILYGWSFNEAQM